MITDEIKKEYNPEHKPRFFLHDEMKLWLKDNLKLYLINGLGNPVFGNTAQKLNLYHPLRHDFTSIVKITIDDEVLSESTLYIDNQGTTDAITKLTELLEVTMNKNAELSAELGLLKLEVEQLKQKNNG